jgi:predicted Zn-dependent peptidase
MHLRSVPVRARVRALLAVLALCLSATLAVASVRPPRLHYQVHTLPNGLTVILSEDRSTPIVHSQIWYHVGSKDERPGRTGFAHLFEHMMFKGSKNVGPEEHTSTVAGVGGQSNAYTTEDVTVFWNTVPAHHLPLVLWLEADRMASLRVDERTFRNEREVVKEERRMRIDNQPYGSLQEHIYRQAFTVHPYKHPIIGSLADLESATIEDVRDFYETYYVPGNATLVIAGDFDSARALALVTKHFGEVPAAETPIARSIPKEPPQARERRVTLHEDWPLPVVVVSHHVTHDGDPDAYPLHIAAKILSDGQSSRIFRRLVYEERSAVAAFGQANLIEHPNLFYAVAMVQPGHTPEAVARSLIDELDRMKAEPVTERELQRAKNQFARDYVIGRESIQEKAMHLAHAHVLHDGDTASADGEFDIFQRTTVADVQRVAQRYFTPRSRLVLTILPKTATASHAHPHEGR